MKYKKTITVARVKVARIKSNQFKNQILDFARLYLGNERCRFSVQELNKMHFEDVFNRLEDVLEVLKPFAELSETDILSDTDVVKRIKAYYFNQSYGGNQDWENFVNEGVENNTPEYFVNMMILEACANFVLANVFKLNWNSIRKMMFGKKLEYIRIRYHLVSCFVKNLNC